MKNKEKIPITEVEKINFFSSVSEKDRPPISPIPRETRELARRSLDDFTKNVEKAKQKALENDAEVEIDGSRLSGVKSGDFWVINKDGIKERYFEKNEGLLDGLLQRRTERVADPNKDVNLEELLKILSYAQWAPNATNEQPTRIMIYRKSHHSMQKIGELMHKALYEKIMPNINIRNFIINKKRENSNFLPEFSLTDLTEMEDDKFESLHFEKMKAPLNELPQTAAKLLERDKIIIEDGKYFIKKSDGKKGNEYLMKDLLQNDKVFTSGMGKFFLKFKNTHPFLVIVFRKWHYTSLMTETLDKYGIQLPDVGEEFIDAGFYTDHLALAARGFGLSGIVKTGPMDLAKDELTELFIEDLKVLMDNYKNFLKSEKSLQEEKANMINNEIEKIDLLYKGLKFGLEAMRCKEQNRQLREPLQVAIKRGEVYVPATFFQLGHPIPQTEARILDPRQGKDSLAKMMIYMGE